MTSGRKKVYNELMSTLYSQAPLPLDLPGTNGRTLTDNGNEVKAGDRAFHEWYRFVLSYPPHLVREYFQRFSLSPGDVVLDPFCGTGTTLAEAKLNRLQAVGIEANPFPHFASTVKTDWRIDPIELVSKAERIAEAAHKALREQGIDDNKTYDGNSLGLRTLSPEAAKALIKDSISPVPLHKTLVLLDKIRLYEAEASHQYYLLALGKALVTSISNLKFGPEVGVGRVKEDVAVIRSWLAEVQRMADDVRALDNREYLAARVYLNDVRSWSQTCIRRWRPSVLSAGHDPYWNDPG